MDIFTYTNSNGEIRIGEQYYLIKPEKLDSISRVKMYDETAARAIKDATALIAVMNEYRHALYVRFNEINETNYSFLLSVKREIRYYENKKIYFVTIAKVFDRKDVAPETVLRERYEGRERHKALARFEELKKQYPNIRTEKDINKKQWEK